MEIVFALGKYKREDASIVIIASVVSEVAAGILYGFFDWPSILGSALGGLAAFVIKKTIKG